VPKTPKIRKSNQNPMTNPHYYSGIREEFEGGQDVAGSCIFFKIKYEKTGR
jgi:hypothetical protein